MIAFSPPPRAPIGIARYVRLDATSRPPRWRSRSSTGGSTAASASRCWPRSPIGHWAAGIRRFHVRCCATTMAARALASQTWAAHARRRRCSPPPQYRGAQLLARGTVGPTRRGRPRPRARRSPPSPPPLGTDPDRGRLRSRLDHRQLAPRRRARRGPSSPNGRRPSRSSRTGTCERRTKSASGSSM